MDKIFYNGRIVTMAEADAESCLRNAPEAVLVSDGKIKALGSYKDLKLKAEDAEEIDLQGKCLMPSFLDGHGHCQWSGKTKLSVNLSKCTCFQDIIDALKKYIEINKPTPDITVFADNYDETKLKEGRHPDKSVLDQASTVIPIQATHVLGHVGCANSACIKQAGIDENTPDPEGGHIDRIPGTTEPSGFFQEAAYDMIRQASRAHFKPDLEVMAKAMQEDYLRNGVTTIQDGHSVDGEFKLLKAMAEKGLLKVDTVSYLSMPLGAGHLMHDEPDYTHGYNNRLKIGGYKMIMDGALTSRTAYLSKPYEGEDEYRGILAMSDQVVHDFMTTALSEDRQILGHCIGDGTSDQFIRIFKQVQKETGKYGDLRPIMIHCQTVRPDQLDEMADLNMIASVFMSPVYYFGELDGSYLGEERKQNLSPAGDALRHGVKITFHHDSPITPPDMLLTVWIAVNRLTEQGNVIGEHQKISVYEALKAVTINTAYGYFEEDLKGSIEVGKLADLVILDQSPLDVDPMAIKDIKVLETIKEGETVWKL